MGKRDNMTSKQILVTVIVAVVLGVGLFFAVPYYKVWQQEMSGRAEFAKAEQNRKIKIEEAKANLEAEKLNAQAEIERAKGAAKRQSFISPQRPTCLYWKQAKTASSEALEADDFAGL